MSVTNKKNVVKNPLEAFKKAEELKPAAGISGRNGGIGSINIIHNAKSHRITFSKALHEAIGMPERVKFSSSSGFLFMQSADSEDYGNAYNVKQDKVLRKSIYSAALTRSIVNEFNLDYSEKTSLAFSQIDVIENNGIKIAAVTIPAVFGGTVKMNHDGTNLEDEVEKNKA